MGCYMSVPDNKVYVTEGKGKNFTYATASCQGWRREQEDAEDCIPDFDDNASLFILCDGHGGAEVAKYTVQHLPNFIKNHPLYKEGKYEKALEKAFIDFDEMLNTEKVANELHDLAFGDDDRKTDEDRDGKESKVMKLNKDEDVEKNSSAAGSSSTTTATAPIASSSSPSAGPSGSACTSSSYNGSSSVVEDVDTETLRREAQLPLRELLNEYSAISGIDPAKRNSLLAKFNSSPVVRNKQEKDEDKPSCSASTSSRSNDDNPGASSSNQPTDLQQQQEEDSEDSDPSTSIGPESIKEAIMKQVMEKYFPGDDDSSDDSEFDGEDSSNDDDGDDEGDDDTGQSSSKKLRRKKHKRPIDESIGSSSEDSDDDDDEDDDDNDEEDDYSDSDQDDEMGDEEDDDDDEEDEADDEEEDPERRKREFVEDEDEEDLELEYVREMLRNKPPDEPMRPTHKPGRDSGCTVVVALIKDGKLYVASAGDSRCIMIMRNGCCKPMSFDHKPEDPIERRRIYRAGGKVTEGRVNGGLNLSRALGDFAYKMENLKAKDQMITPCPDVRVADICPDEVEYIFLACDGIWNSMKNIQASTFIRKTAPALSNNLVETCLHLFRKCIAPGTDGDGTGCDNMTCILAKFECPSDETSNNSDLKTEQEGSESVVSSSQKRSSNDDSNDAPVKRRCLRL